MKCPHCGSQRKQPVYETRRSEDEMWRRRTCMGCGKNYVTVESAGKELKMPNELTNYKLRQKHHNG